MAQNESISLHESAPPYAGEQELHDLEHDASSPDQANSRRRESKTTRICVLVGSAILQLPIWGTYILHPGRNCTYTRRFRYELWRLPRVPVQQLDAARIS